MAIDKLEDIPTWEQMYWDLQRNYASLRTQRDEMLKALKGVAE